MAVKRKAPYPHLPEVKSQLVVLMVLVLLPEADKKRTNGRREAVLTLSLPTLSTFIAQV
jgi:hypothetical protein